jgi:hypothetical protein
MVMFSMETTRVLQSASVVVLMEAVTTIRLALHGSMTTAHTVTLVSMASYLHRRNTVLITPNVPSTTTAETATANQATKAMEIPTALLQSIPAIVVRARMVAFAFQMIMDIDVTVPQIRRDPTASKWSLALPNLVVRMRTVLSTTTDRNASASLDIKAIHMARAAIVTRKALALGAILTTRPTTAESSTIKAPAPMSTRRLVQMQHW